VFLRLIKFFAAVLLFPAVCLVAAGTLKAFFALFARFEEGFPFLLGAGIYVLAHFGVGRPGRFYVLTHEMTHAAAAWSSGFKVKRMKVGKNGGAVVLDGSNAFVALAPYCLPLYAALLVIGYAAGSLFYDLKPWNDFFTFGLGLFMAFHIVNTAETLISEKQSDLPAAGGVVFSLAVIILANCAVVLTALKFLYPETVNVRHELYAVWNGSSVFWQKVLDWTVQLYAYLQDKLKT